MEATVIHADRWMGKRKEGCDEHNRPFRNLANASRITSLYVIGHVERDYFCLVGRYNFCRNLFIPFSQHNFVPTYKTERCHFSENQNPNNHCCKKL